MYFHSVTLDKDKCHGCTNCIKRCPTEAIRVRDGKAKIIKERCIDCGECIRACQHRAKLAVTDGFERLNEFKYNIAMPAPSLYGQFRDENATNKVLTALLEIGFDDVFEVARGAEAVSEATREYLKRSDINRPAISSACPAIVRMIRERFPELIKYVVPLLSPMEFSAIKAREIAREKTGYEDDEIGVFFITPCPAKVTAIKSPLTTEKSAVSGAISVNDIYGRIFPIVKNMKEPKKLSVSGYEGISWARSGGESAGAKTLLYIAVDGINHVIGILEELEDNRLDDVDFIELSACDGGCVGGSLNVANGYVASTRIKNLKHIGDGEKAKLDIKEGELGWRKQIESHRVMQLDDDFKEAMKKMERMEEIYAQMPKLDCGSCGAPSCRALAEDIVRGFASEDDCIFKMREKIKELAEELTNSRKDVD